jgi:aarF domain-containing kinase
VLQDRAPFRPFHIMKRVILSELGIADVSERFAYFEPIPIAAASLAQVHRARTLSGDNVAVKIQYPDIPRLFYLDTATLQLLSDLASLLFSDFSMSWVISGE